MSDTAKSAAKAATLPGSAPAQAAKKTRPFHLRWLGFAQQHPVAFVLAMIGASVLAGVPGTDAVDLYFSSGKFCADTCHVMKDTVYQEYQESSHWKTATGVRPTCSDCHISRRITMAMWGHLLGMRELITFALNDFSAPDAFEKFRPDAANRVRMGMVANNSRTCRHCHVMEAIQPEKKRGQRQHKEALEKDMTCILCHYNLVHKKVEPSEAFIAEIQKY